MRPISFWWGQPGTRTLDIDWMVEHRPQVTAEWRHAILHHPILYLRTRLHRFARQMGFGEPTVHYPFHEGIDSNPHGWELRSQEEVHHALRVLQTSVRDSIFFRGWFWTSLLLVLTVACVLRRDRNPLAVWIGLSGLGYVTGYLFTAAASDFRYLFWSIVALFAAASVWTVPQGARLSRLARFRHEHVRVVRAVERIFQPSVRMSVTRQRGSLVARVRNWLALSPFGATGKAPKSDYEAYMELLEQLCREFRPERVLEFGSGVSTRIFARHAAVTTVEYDPPGDWYANEVGSDDHIERVTFRFVKPETNPYPQNLLASFYALIAEELKEDPAREFKIINGHPPLWDIAFVDGAVHMEGLVVDQRFPGWSPGDLSYLARTTVAGLCSLVAKRVIIDDLSYMPPLSRSRVEQRGRLFILHTTA